MGLVYFVLKCTKFNVKVLFQNDSLMNADLQRGKHISLFLGKEWSKRVKYISSLPKQKLNKNTVVIIDESDYFMFKDPDEFHKKINQSQCYAVCLTGTVYDGTSLGFEYGVIKAM